MVLRITLRLQRGSNFTRLICRLIHIWRGKGIYSYFKVLSVVECQTYGQ